jgi:hypothetical protein
VTYTPIIFFFCFCFETVSQEAQAIPNFLPG